MNRIIGQVQKLKRVVNGNGKNIVKLVGLASLLILTILALHYFGVVSAKSYCLWILFFSVCLALVIFSINKGKQYWGNKQGQKIYRQLQIGTEHGAAGKLEIAILKEKMRGAVDSLRSSELGIRYRGKSVLYALPWYILIGPSAAGKTTLLKNSKLNFPFASAEDLHIKGLGGTRHCDWWFSNEAILIDTAGRYTTEEKGREEWQTFLSLLKKYRPRQPINGIMIALSIVEIIMSDSAQREQHIKIMRHRVDEIKRKLNYILPVFFIITKADSLKGFEEFFGDDSNILEDIFGVTAVESINTKNFSDIFVEKTTELEARLRWLRLKKLSLEQDPAKKQLIYDFPEIFFKALEKIAGFVKELVGQNPYQSAPDLCGVYFTSAEQSSAKQLYLTIDDSMEFVAIAEANTAGKASRSYFIKEMIGRIICYHDLSTRLNNNIFSRSFLKVGALVTMFVFVFISFLFLSASFTSNSILLQHTSGIMSDLVSHIVKDQQSSIEQIDVLEQTYHYYQYLEDNNANLPWHLRLGLYRGNNLLNPLAQMMALTIDSSFVSSIKSFLERQLSENAIMWKTNSSSIKLRGEYYNNLKVYLMLCYPEKIDTDSISIIFANDWRKMLTQDFRLSEISAKDLDGLSVIYLNRLKYLAQHNILAEDSLKALTPEVKLINQARVDLYLPDNAMNLFSALQDKSMIEFPAVNVRDLVRNEGAEFFENKVSLPGMYTAVAWNNKIQAEVKRLVDEATPGDWVIEGGSSSNISKQNSAGTLLQKINAEYFSAYNQAWLDFLNSISIYHSQSLNEASKEILVLSHSEGVISELLKIIAANTLLSDIGSEHGEVGEADLFLKNIQSLWTNGKEDRFDGYFKELAHIQSDMERLVSSPDVVSQAQQYSTQLLSGVGANLELYRGSVLAEMLAENVNDSSVQFAVKNILLLPIREAWRSIVDCAVSGIQKDWKDQVIPIYQQVLQNKFPFSKVGEEANMTDVINFFKPQEGVLWMFVKLHLSAYLVFQQQQWTTRKWLDVGASFSDAFLNSLTQAQYITNALFSQEIAAPKLLIELYPEPTPGVTQIILKNGQYIYRYYNGPQQWSTFNWSSSEADQNSSLYAITQQGDELRPYSYQGIWGLFHLFSQARVSRLNEYSYELSWDFSSSQNNHYTIRFLTRANDANSIVENMIIKPFHLTSEILSWRVL